MGVDSPLTSWPKILLKEYATNRPILNGNYLRCDYCNYLNARQPSPNKKSTTKKYFTIHIHNMSDSIYLYQPAPPSPSSLSAVSIFTVSAFIFLNSLLTFPSSLLPFHYISSSDSSNVLDIQQFSKPPTLTSGEMCYYVVMIQ